MSELDLVTSFRLCLRCNLVVIKEIANSSTSDTKESGATEPGQEAKYRVYH